MAGKSELAGRLQRLQAMEGVLPTAMAPAGARARGGAANAGADAGIRGSAARRAGWARVARSLNARDSDAAASASRAVLATELADGIAEEPATGLFSGLSETRKQAEAFAAAGIGFFHARADFASASLPERGARGGNGTVTRVMMDGTRILLESQRIVVRFRKGARAADRRAALSRHGLVSLGGAGLPPDTERAACEKAPATDLALDLLRESVVAWAEPDFIEQIGTRRLSTDPMFGRQWHHMVIGCPEAWETGTGKGIRIAVIDNGFDTSHPDLRFGALTGGFRPTPDFQDADFAQGIAAISDGDHGTACAGMIAGIEGNGHGGCGVAFDADLSMIACMDDQIGTQATLARAIAYAADPSLEGVGGEAGADVIACSLGPNTATWTMREVLSDAITFARRNGRGGKGTCIFWACTNGNFPVSADEVCSHRHVIAVGRSTSGDSDNGSGFGPELEYLAPGVDVVIPASGGGYQTTTGTSFAAPCAAGVAALALSVNPGLTAIRLKGLMRRSCDRIGTLPYVKNRNVRFGFGRVNAARAVAKAAKMKPTV
jgi:thermitase